MPRHSHAQSITEVTRTGPTPAESHLDPDVPVDAQPQPTADSPHGSPLPSVVIEAEIGRGGMCVFLRARQPFLDRQVALKLLISERFADGDATYAARFNLKNAAAAHLLRCTKLEMACAIPAHRAPCSWTTSAFSGHQMGGQERQLKMDKSRRSGGFTNSIAFLRFNREARILASLHHPNIAACHEAGATIAGISYLLMELVEGPSLGSWLTEHGPLPLAHALEMAKDLAGALAHAKGRESERGPSVNLLAEAFWHA